jgi:hypothetical protein
MDTRNDNNWTVEFSDLPQAARDRLGLAMWDSVHALADLGRNDLTPTAPANSVAIGVQELVGRLDLLAVVFLAELDL